MNVYDFDNTIYDGETVVDFFFFYLKKDPGLLRLVPAVLANLVKYKLGRITVSELEALAEKYLGLFLEKAGDLQATVAQFWDKHQHKIKSFYRSMQRADDVVVSASCDFLLYPICSQLGIRHCLCSAVDIKTGKILRICYRENKPILFRQEFGDTKIENFYSDSLHDLPMMKLAKNAYIVKGDQITKVDVGANTDAI